MSLLGKNVRLTGVSQKGKNRVRENGSVWQVLAETDVILFAPDKTGPWLFVAPPGKTMHDKSSRWVHLREDPDFRVEEL
jgi:hypothetical protein